MRILKIETHQTLGIDLRGTLPIAGQVRSYIAKKNVFPYRLNSNRRRVFHFTKLLLKICTVSEIRRVELYFINNWRDQTTSTSQLEEMYNCTIVQLYQSRKVISRKRFLFNFLHFTFFQRISQS